MPRQRENWICDWDIGPMEKSCDIIDKYSQVWPIELDVEFSLYSKYYTGE